MTKKQIWQIYSPWKIQKAIETGESAGFNLIINKFLGPKPPFHLTMMK